MAPPDTITALGRVLTLDVHSTATDRHYWRGEAMPGVPLVLVHWTEGSIAFSWSLWIDLDPVRPMGTGPTPDDAERLLCLDVQEAVRKAHLLGQLVHLLTPSRAA
jgi:hypothetical protein